MCQNFVLTLLVLPCDSCFVSWRSSFVCIWIMRGHLRSFHLHTADRRNNAWHCTSSLIIRRPHCSNELPSSLSLSTKKLFSLSLFITTIAGIKESFKGNAARARLARGFRNKKISREISCKKFKTHLQFYVKISNTIFSSFFTGKSLYNFSKKLLLRQFFKKISGNFLKQIRGTNDYSKKPIISMPLREGDINK